MTTREIPFLHTLERVHHKFVLLSCLGWADARVLFLILSQLVYSCFCFRVPVVFRRAFPAGIRWHLPRLPPSYRWHSCCNPSSVRRWAINYTQSTALQSRVSKSQWKIRKTLITMSGYPMPLIRKKADKELSASADSFSHTAHTAANSHLPCAPTTGRQLQIGDRRVRETVLVVFKNEWQNEAFPVKSFADVRDRHKHSHADIPPKSEVASYHFPAPNPPHLWQEDQCPSS